MAASISWSLQRPARTEQSGDRTSVEIYRAVQTCPKVQPTSCTMGTGSFPEIKRPERGADHPTPSEGLRMCWSYTSASPLCLDRHVIGRHFFFFFFFFVLFFPFLWRFDSIPSHGFPLRCFTITLRHITLGRTPLDE
jgi:hypothetical protein